MYLIEVLNYIPLKIFVIQEYQFDKYLNDIIEEKNIEQGIFFIIKNYH